MPADQTVFPLNTLHGYVILEFQTNPNFASRIEAKLEIVEFPRSDDFDHGVHKTFADTSFNYDFGSPILSCGGYEASPLEIDMRAPIEFFLSAALW